MRQKLLKKAIIFDLDNTIVVNNLNLTKISKCLHELKKNYLLILLTNSSEREAAKKVKLFKLEQLFDRIVSSKGFILRKPLKTQFKRALAGLKLKEVWVIGDNQFTDVLGAKRMGFKSILVGKEKSIIKPDFYAKNVFDAIKIIRDKDGSNRKM